MTRTRGFPMNGATRLLMRAIMELEPTAMLRTGVGNSSAVYKYIVLNVPVIAIFPIMVSDVTMVE